MNKTGFIILLSLVCLSIACNTANDHIDEFHVNTIKFEPQDHSTIFIEDIADTSFFRVLSTDQDFFLSYIQEIYFSDSLMIIPQEDEGAVYLYDLDGNPVRKINVIGRSGGTLSEVTDVWYNENSQLIDFYDYRLPKVLSYDLNGKPIKDIKIEGAELGPLELRYARSENVVAIERLTAAGDDNGMRLGIYSPELKFQGPALPIPEKLKNVNFGRTHIFDVYNDSLFYLPFLETRILSVSPEGVATAYEFDIPKNNRASEDYLNETNGDLDAYFAEMGTTDFIHSFENLFVTDKYISFNYNKGGNIDRNNVFFSKETNDVLQFSNWKSRALPGMELLSVIRGVMGDYFVINVNSSQNRYLLEGIQDKLDDNSNTVLLFFKLKEF